jgi:hypothetical protein
MLQNIQQNIAPVIYILVLALSTHLLLRASLPQEIVPMTERRHKQEKQGAQNRTQRPRSKY